MTGLEIWGIGSIVWVAFEQIVAANKKWKSNSTLQLIINIGKTIFAGKR